MRQVFSWVSWLVAASIGLGGTFAGYYVLNQRTPRGEFIPGNVGSGAQIILGAAVAAFALAQATISAQATRAARDAVLSTDRQTEVMRQEFEHSKTEALAAYQIAREERLDVGAPQVSLTCTQAHLYGAPGSYLQVVPHRTIRSGRGDRAMLLFEAAFNLHNHGSMPIRFDAELITTDWIPDEFQVELSGPLKSTLGPNASAVYRATLGPQSVEEYARFSAAASKDGHQRFNWFRLQVKVVQASYTVMDTHSAWVFPPRILTDELDGHVQYVASEEPIPFAQLAVVQRRYQTDMMRETGTIEYDWPY